MAKLNIDFILIDESVVMNGFRALMKGAQLASFKANPVMLFLHNRATGDNATELVILPIGKWYDIRIDGNKLLAKPDFDDNDEFALKIQSKVDGGYLNGASIWLDPLAASDDSALMLPGQLGPTITKWGVLEASIVDIPNCRNALAIRNSAGKKIALSADTDSEINNYLKSLIPKKSKMLKLLAVKLGLPDTATEEEVANKLAAVQSEAANVLSFKTENQQLKDKIVELNAAATSAKVEALIDGAISANKLAAGDREKYLKLAKADFDTTKELIDGMKPYKSIETQLSATTESNAGELAELTKLSGTDLWKQGKLERLQKLSAEQFKLKYKEAFGVEYKS